MNSQFMSFNLQKEKPNKYQWKEIVGMNLYFDKFDFTLLYFNGLLKHIVVYDLLFNSL